MKTLFKSLFKSKANSSCVLSSEDSLYKVTEQDILKFLEHSSGIMEELNEHAHKMVINYDLNGPWDLSLREIIVSYVVYTRTGDIIY